MGLIHGRVPGRVRTTQAVGDGCRCNNLPEFREGTPKTHMMPLGRRRRTSPVTSHQWFSKAGGMGGWRDMSLFQTKPHKSALATWSR